MPVETDFNRTCEYNEKHKFDACMGGARRDEEKARAKERFLVIVMNLVNRILKIKDQNCGISLMGAKNSVKISGYFL